MKNIINKIILLISVIFLSINSYANIEETMHSKKRKIVTSIPPVANLIEILIRDNAEISVINDSAFSAHHYHSRPSDKGKIEGGDLIIYIDDKFESFMPKLAKANNLNIFKISSINSIKWNDFSGKRNWHFWLDLDNVIIAQSGLAELLIEKFPELEDKIRDNLSRGQENIQKLIAIRSEIFRDIKPVIILHHSLEHLFTGLDQDKIIRKYQSKHASLKFVQQLEQITKGEKNKNKYCMVIDKEQDFTKYDRYNQQIIRVNSENWDLDYDFSSPWDWFYIKYMDILDELSKCRN